MKVYEIPEGGRATKGRAIQNLINIPADDRIKAFINVKNLNDEEYLNNNFIIMCTKQGVIKKTTLEAYSRPRSNGINAITIREGDELLDLWREFDFPVVHALAGGRRTLGIAGGTDRDGPNESASPDLGFDEAVSCELLVGECDRVPVKAELDGQLANRRQARAGGEPPGLDLGRKLRGDPLVGRQSIFRIE